jgi:hypothetical protein
VSKTNGRYGFELRPEFKAQAKPKVANAKNGVVTENNTHFLLDKYIDMEKRMLYCETKMKKYKKLVKGLYEEVPTGETPEPEPEPEVVEQADEEPDKVEEIIKPTGRGSYGSRRR